MTTLLVTICCAAATLYPRFLLLCVGGMLLCTGLANMLLSIPKDR